MARKTSDWIDGSHLQSRELQAIVEPLQFVAQGLEATLNNGPEKSAGMRKLLEAKDCFVRQAIEDRDGTS